MAKGFRHHVFGRWVGDEARPSRYNTGMSAGSPFTRSDDANFRGRCSWTKTATSPSAAATPPKASASCSIRTGPTTCPLRYGVLAMDDRVEVNGAKVERRFFEDCVREAKSYAWVKTDPGGIQNGHAHCIICNDIIDSNGCNYAVAYHSLGGWLCPMCYTEYVAASNAG